MINSRLSPSQTRTKIPMFLRSIPMEVAISSVKFVWKSFLTSTCTVWGAKNSSEKISTFASLATPRVNIEIFSKCTHSTVSAGLS